MPLKKWNKLGEKTVIENDHWAYKIDMFELDDRTRGEYHYVFTYGSSMVIPVTESGRLLLVKQYRYLNGRESIEFPCGGVEKDLSPEENALKELREETGYTAGFLRFTGEFTPFTGACSEICSVFLARELSWSPLPSDEFEEFELLELSLREVEYLIQKGIIFDGLTISAFTLAKKHIINLAGKKE